MDGQNMEMPTPEKSNGPVVGIIVVIIVLAIGAYYLYAELQSQQAARELAPQVEESDMSDQAAVDNIEADLNATDVSDLEADLNTDLDALDSELQNL